MPKNTQLGWFRTPPNLGLSPKKHYFGCFPLAPSSLFSMHKVSSALLNDYFQGWLERKYIYPLPFSRVKNCCVIKHLPHFHFFCLWEFVLLLSHFFRLSLVSVSRGGKTQVTLFSQLKLPNGFKEKVVNLSRRIPMKF